MKFLKNYILTFLVLMVFTSNAQILHDNAFGTTDWDAANDIIITNDNHYMLLGTFYQNIYLAKVDTTTQLIWEKAHPIDGFLLYPKAICEIGDTSFVVSGIHENKGFLLKVDELGDSLCNLKDTVILGNNVSRVLRAPDGNLIVLAYFNSGFYSVVKLGNELNVINKLDTITTVVKDIEVIGNKIYVLLDDSVNNLLIVDNNLTQIDTIDAPVNFPDYLIPNFNKTSFVVEGRDSSDWYLPHKMVYFDLLGNINSVCNPSYSGGDWVDEFVFYNIENEILKINYYYSNPWGIDIKLEFTDSCMQVLYDTILYRGGTVLEPEKNETVKKVLIDPNGNLALYITGDDGPIGGDQDLFLVIYKPWDGILTGIEGLNIETAQLEKDIVVYPNPSQGQFKVTGITKNSNIIVMDAMGKIVYANYSSPTTHHTIPTTNWAKGLYVIQIKNFEKTTTLKVVKQ